MSQFLHFTLGPVQGFVAQARRTRDFWAGSFLLSWLTAHAIKAVQDAGGTIVMPSVCEDDMLKMLNGADVKNPPKIGSLPNNFIAKVSDEFDGNTAVKAVQAAWKALADAVWKEDKLEAAGVSKELWDSQIESFWDMAWVISGSDDAAVLAQRKNWRSYMPPESLGDKCTMMGEWQELSGAEKPNPEQQRNFWQQLKSNAGISDIELRENERLCAIAYVKRRFVHVWEKLDGHQGWKLPTSVPSTSYMAAVHWLEKLIGSGPEPQATLDFARKATSGERLTRIACISGALKDKPEYLKNLADVDGRSLFDSDKAEDAKFVGAKKAMLKTVQDFNTPLSPFYAILMMDGDSLGETKAAMKDAKDLSKALAKFTNDVPGIIEEHNGFLVYAGGDDVLAILPLEDAMGCALACRNAYMGVFSEKELEQGTYSISAAIEYAHMKLPLTMILKDAHKLLDDVAKDATGRDAIACRIWKPGGIQQTWAMPWDEAVKGKTFILEDLAKKLGDKADKSGKKEQSDPAYASKLLYHIRETLDMLQGGGDIDSQAIEDMLVADYVSSGLLEGMGNKLQVARELIQPLLEQCRIFENKKDTKTYSADGALLLRFLAQKGVEQ